MSELKKSCLNEEYTIQIETIGFYMKEASKLYNDLPACIRDTETVFQKNGGETPGYYLLNGLNSFINLAKEFGIELS